MRGRLLLAAAVSPVFATLMTSLPAKTQDGAFLDLRAPLPTPAPRYIPERLYQRDTTLGTDTCGFGQIGDALLTYQCYQTVGTCVDIGDYRGCCTGGISECTTTFVTTCLDYDPRTSNIILFRTVSCDSHAPYCIKWLFSTEVGTTYTAWDCAAQSDTTEYPLGTVDLAGVTTDADSSMTTTGPASMNSNPSATRASSSTDTDTASGSGSSTASGSSPTSPTNNNTSTDTPSDKSSSSSSIAGPVAGGVVGGLAVIGAVALGFFFLRKHYGKKEPRGEKRPASPPLPTNGPSEVQGSDASEISHVPSPHNAGGGYPYPGQGQGYYSPVSPSGHYQYGTPPPPPQSHAVEAPLNPAVGTHGNAAEAPASFARGSRDNRAELS